MYAVGKWSVLSQIEEVTTKDQQETSKWPSGDTSMLFTDQPETRESKLQSTLTQSPEQNQSAIMANNDTTCPDDK